MNEVDFKRLAIVKNFSLREKAAFVVGLSYFRAFGVSKELQMGVALGVNDAKMLEDVNWALGLLGQELLPDCVAKD